MARTCRSPPALAAQATCCVDPIVPPVTPSTSPNGNVQLPAAALIVCQRPPLLSMARTCTSPPALAAQATCCVDPIVPPVTPSTSPNGNVQLPAAALIVCQRPPLLSMARTCTSPPALAAQATCCVDPIVPPVTPSTSPNGNVQLPAAALIVCQRPPLLSMARTCTSPPALAAQATCCVDPIVPPVTPSTSPNGNGQLPAAARIVCQSLPILSMARTCRPPPSLPAQATCCVDPIVPPVTPSTSPNGNGQLPAAARI